MFRKLIWNPKVKKLHVISEELITRMTELNTNLKTLEVKLSKLTGK